MSAICGKCGGELIGFGADANCPFCELAALRAENERLNQLLEEAANALRTKAVHIEQLKAALRDIAQTDTSSRGRYASGRSRGHFRYYTLSQQEMGKVAADALKSK